MILKRASADQDLVSAKVVEDQATKLGNACLRTLAIAYKNIKRSHYERWYEEHWKPSIEDYLNRNKIIDKASGSWNFHFGAFYAYKTNSVFAEIIETDLQLLGVTGVEDELQDNVPETISRLLHAGIKIWVVVRTFIIKTRPIRVLTNDVQTGDKRETAFNIASACNLVHESSTVFLQVRSEADKSNISSALTRIQDLKPDSHEYEWVTPVRTWHFRKFNF